MKEGFIKISKYEKADKGQSGQLFAGPISRIDRMESGTACLKQERNPVKLSKQAKIALVALFVVFVSIVIVKFDISELQQLITQNQKLTLTISFCAIVLTGLTLVVPTAPITLLLSLLIGPLQAIIISILGNLLTALVHYQLGKHIGDVMNFEEKKASLPFKLGKLPMNSPLFLLVGRGLPGGPKGLSFVCGAYGVPIFLYLWTTFVTELLGAVFIAYGGDELIRRI
jgi:uncharacterized membrane protein YdjX (TVP38/TMEM64 family)